jgi:tryptophan 2,3-dioxygenase
MTGCPAGYGNTESTSTGVKSDSVRPKRGDKAVYYHDYLCLDQILNAQHLKSLELGGKAAHDEHLFIVIHQAYELWFKQCLHEVGSVMDIFRQVPIEESKLGTVANRLNRCAITLHVIIQQLDILETMSPLDFLDFRDFLFPASGFQVSAHIYHLVFHHLMYS